MVKKNILPVMIDTLRKKNDWTLEELGSRVDKSKSAISRWIKGDRSPMIEDLEKLSQVFNVDISTLLYGEKKVTISKTMASIVKNIKVMNDKQLKETLNYTQNLLAKSAKVHVFPIKVTEALAAGVGYSYGNNNVTTLYTDRDDLKQYDIASRVSGDSMEPTYSDGDVVLIQSNTSYDNGYIYAIDFNEKSYLKKVYFEKNYWRLVSLNDKYDDIIIPLNTDKYLNIVGRVVDVFTPITQ